MPAAFQQGPVSPGYANTFIPVPVLGVAVNWFAQRNPLFSRLNKVGHNSHAFKLIGHKYRPRSGTLGAAIADGVTTTITLTDASFVMKGDIISINGLGSGVEYVEVTADPTITNTTSGAGTITVRRGIAGTTAVAASNSVPFYVIGNSRTGAEDNPTAIQAALSASTQYMQTVQHPYSVGGAVQTNDLFPLIPGAQTPLEQYKMDAFQNATDDFEYSACYGLPEDPLTASTAGRGKQAGLRNIITTNLNTNPTNKTAYTAVDFQRDFLTVARQNGGAPDMIFLASNWMGAFAKWSIPLNQYVQGRTEFGVEIRSWSSSFLGNALIVEAPLLPAFTGFALTSAEARWRVKRPLMDEPFAKSGDVNKGHIIGEMAIDLENEAHHTWVEGVTAFA